MCWFGFEISLCNPTPPIYIVEVMYYNHGTVKLWLQTNILGLYN